MAAIDINDVPDSLGPGEGALAPLRQASGVPAMPWSYGVPARPEILSAKVNPMELLYALRRRWPLAVGLGLLLGGLMAAVVWMIVPIRAEAAAMLKVYRAIPPVTHEMPAAIGANLDFEVYKRTHAALIKSNYVMQAVLRNPKVAKLPMIQKQKDPVSFLINELIVDYPGEAEILRIAMKGDNTGGQLITLVNEVKEAYMSEIVMGERTDRVRLKEKMEASVRARQKEIEDKTTKLRALEQTAKAGAQAVLQRTLATRRLEELVSKVSRLESEMSDIEMRLLLLKTHEKSAAPLTLPPGALSELIHRDSECDRLTRELSALNRQMKAHMKTAKDPNAPGVQRISEMIEADQEELDARKMELRKELEEKTAMSDGKGGTGASKEMLETQFKALAEERDQAAGKVQKAVETVNRIEETNAEIESRKTELHNLAELTNQLAKELQLLELNMSTAQARIVPIDENAVLQPTNDAVRKYVGTAFAGMLGFGLMLFGIAFLEFQSRRLNSSGEVHDGLGIRVLGDLPPLSGRAWRRMNSGKSSAGTMQAMLAESIDNIRTTLIHTTSVESPRVVMVTSAEPQEGKTTVATQLAASLARAGRRTLLIDGDLRSPAAHRVFDLALEPGFCEFLRAEVQLQAIVYPTPADNLWLLPAGHCDLRSVQALANNKIGDLFDTFRAQFEFIILDAGPVLKVADTLLLGQHVDAAIVSVLRNVSKVPKVYEACERLRSVGVTVLGSVVNGVSGHVPRGVDLHLPPVEAS